jgi:hypothetical protein
MTDRITTEDVIGGVVSKLREKRKGVITSVSYLGENIYQLSTATTFDISKGQFLTVLGFSVYVVEVLQNSYINVESGNDLTTATEWQSSQPYFYYGDPVDINNEINRGTTDIDTKYPAVIMFEVQREKFYNDQSNLIGSEPTVRLFFMDQENYEDSSIDDLYSTVDRMKNLSIEFIKQLDLTKGVYIQDSEYTISNHSKWGVKVIKDRRTSSETIFDNNLTGVELVIDVPLSKTLQFKCEC